MIDQDSGKGLDRILTNAITGKISLDLRKRLAAGEVAAVSAFGEAFTIEVVDGKALMKSGEAIILEKNFVPWDSADDDYQAMITSFDGEGVDQQWFERASENFHSRFEE